LTHLPDAQARAFGIADNRLTENSTWDDRLLGEILGDLAIVDLDFAEGTSAPVAPDPVADIESVLYDLGGRPVLVCH
jgi:hypothetical protein